ncbi:DegT/DnrJ/EryC1/StrS family aminotransferase [Alphaproteobacteria bacterium]|nr:DegT/DnrJ/EryC1/StrS family aminotransferase [Alphaproteobacteria bacterium]
MSNLNTNIINWWRTDIGEEEKNALLLAFDEKRFTMSSSVQRVESLASSILDVPYVLMTNSGSSALLMSLLALDINVGDEVIVPSLTWIATAQAPSILGAKVIPCDTLKNEPIIDTALIESLITPKTKAIIPVHLNGRYCNLEVIKNVAKKYNLSIIEDSCKGLFSSRNGQYLGTMGDVGCFSLGMISPVSIGFGGLIATKEHSIYQKLKLIRDHGVIRNPESYNRLGFNFKISDLLASLAIPQFINHQWKANSLTKLHNYYQDNLNCRSLAILNIDKDLGAVPVYVEGYAEDREDLILFLNSHDVHVSRYHNPIHTAKYLHSCQNKFDNAERFASNTFILPCGPSQNIRDIDRVLELLNKY